MMKHLLEILLDELQIDLLKNVYLANISQHEKECIARGIKLDIEHFCNSMRVPEYKKERAFITHIENHLKGMDVGMKVVCKICNKTIDEIADEDTMADDNHCLSQEDKPKDSESKYWIHFDPKTLTYKQNEWEQVEGKKVIIPNLEDYDFFAHQDAFGKYKISEGKTGFAVPRVRETTKDKAVDKAILILFTRNDGTPITLKESRKRQDEAIECAILKYGLSERYKDKQTEDTTDEK